MIGVFFFFLSMLSKPSQTWKIWRRKVVQFFKPVFFPLNNENMKIGIIQNKKTYNFLHVYIIHLKILFVCTSVYISGHAFTKYLREN